MIENFFEQLQASSRNAAFFCFGDIYYLGCLAAA